MFRQCSLTAAVRPTASCWRRTEPAFTRQGTYLNCTWGIWQILFSYCSIFLFLFCICVCCANFIFNITPLSKPVVLSRRNHKMNRSKFFIKSNWQIFRLSFCSQKAAGWNIPGTRTKPAPLLTSIFPPSSFCRFLSSTSTPILNCF